MLASGAQTIPGDPAERVNELPGSEIYIPRRKRRRGREKMFCN